MATRLHEEFVELGGVKTPLLKLGNLKDAVPDGGKRVLMLIIPGNPGLPHYYEDFMQELYSHCEGQVPVWALGHAGHLRPPGAELSFHDIHSTPEDIYGLEAQITHKVNFVLEHIPADVSLILIGHSIGCYMILNMLEKIQSRQILRCFMLFPTIERMAQSPNGIKMTPLLRYLRWMIVLLAYCVCLIPTGLRCRLFRWWYRRVDYPGCMMPAILETATPWTANFTTYLAKLEMNKVCELQKDLISKHASKLSLYYGATDHWAPAQYYFDLREQFPNIDARLCNLNLKHAFVLETVEGREMAKIVWLWAQAHHHTVLSQTGPDSGEEAWIFNE